MLHPCPFDTVSIALRAKSKKNYFCYPESKSPKQKLKRVRTSIFKASRHFLRAKRYINVMVLKLLARKRNTDPEDQQPIGNMIQSIR